MKYKSTRSIPLPSTLVVHPMFGHSFLHTTHLSIVLGSGVVTVLTYLLIQFLLRLLDWCLISKASTAPPRGSTLSSPTGLTPSSRPGYVGEHPKAKDIRDKWKERSIRTVDVPAAACHAAAVLQSTGRRADAEECFQVLTHRGRKLTLLPTRWHRKPGSTNDIS